MNPLLLEWLGSLTRKGLAMLAVFLTQHGLLTESLAGRLTEAGVVLAVSVAWTLWEKYGSRLKLVTALSQGKAMSEKSLEKIIANQDIVNPPVSTPKDAVPSTGEWTTTKPTK